MKMETSKIGYRYYAVDIHSHILPGCDDGAGSLQETLTMLRADRGEGILDVIATSHYAARKETAERVC